MQAFLLKQAECDRLVQHASKDIKDKAVPLLVDSAMAKEIVKLKQNIISLNMPSESMHAILGAALQLIEKTIKLITMTADVGDVIWRQIECAKMERNITNKTLIQVETNSAPISTFKTTCSNYIFKVKMNGLQTYNATRTLDIVIPFHSSLYLHFGTCAKGLDWMEDIALLSTNSSAATAHIQFCANSAAWANHQFLVHSSAGVAWESISATAIVAMNLPKKVTRWRWDW